MGRFYSELAEKSVLMAAQIMDSVECAEEVNNFLEGAKKIYDYITGESYHFKGDKQCNSSAQENDNENELSEGELESKVSTLIRGALKTISDLENIK